MHAWRRAALALAVGASLFAFAIPGRTGAADPQGAIATSHGAAFEQLIAEAVVAKGFAVRGYSEWEDAGEPDGEWLLTNAPYVNLYGGKGRTEFLLLSKSRGLRVRIEAKWQSSPGSVDEKLPYLYLNALKAMPETTVFIVIDGPGWRPGGLAWLRRAAAGDVFGTDPDRDVRIMTLEEFQSWVEALR